MKVDIMIIGAQKSGTTSLAHFLAKHPEVCFCLEKEPGFFNYYTDWEQHLWKYHKLFKPERGQKLAEASTMYTIAPQHFGTHERIFKYNPEVRLIYIMRDPVERVVSQFAHRYIRKKVSSDVTQVLTDESYVFRSSYFYQISPYADIFGLENILLLTFEELVADPQSVLIRISNFVGIDDTYFKNMHEFFAKNTSTNRYVLPENGILKLLGSLKNYRYLLPKGIEDAILKLLGNKIMEKPVFNEDIRQQLYHRVKDDVDKLQQLMGREITEWKRY